MKKFLGFLMLAILSWQSCLAGTIDLKVIYRPYIHHSFQGSPSAIDNVSALIMTNCHFATPGDAYFDPNVRSMRCGYGELLQGFDIMADDEDYIRSFTMSQPEKRTYDLQGRLHSGRGIWVSQQRKRLLKPT